MIMFNLQFGPVSSALERWFDHSTRSVWLAVGSRLESVVGKWALVVLAAAAFKVLRAPTRPSTTIEAIGMAFPFLAIGAAPVVAYRLAMRWPATPTSPVVSHPLRGRWEAARSAEIARARRIGPAGFLVSLSVGLLLNVPFRSLKFLAVVPSVSPSDPTWSHVFVAALTAHVALMNALYMICFVLALRTMPQFPRLMVFVWLADVASQYALAAVLGRAGLPGDLAPMLLRSLQENIVHVFIAVALWLPYLIVSDQVNLLYRGRRRFAIAPAG